MKLITRDIDYGLRALCCIAGQRKTVVSVQELVACLKIPRPFLRKILQVLNRKKLLKSYRGPGGGFVLRRSPDKISLLNLIEAFQGKLKLNECTFKKKACPNIKTCKVKKEIDRLQRYTVQQLKRIKLSGLLPKK